VAARVIASGKRMVTLVFRVNREKSICNHFISNAMNASGLLWYTPFRVD
jgi:hypothetical protein